MAVLLRFDIFEIVRQYFISEKKISHLPCVVKLCQISVYEGQSDPSYVKQLEYILLRILIGKKHPEKDFRALPKV